MRVTVNFDRGGSFHMSDIIEFDGMSKNQIKKEVVKQARLNGFTQKVRDIQIKD